MESNKSPANNTTETVQLTEAYRTLHVRPWSRYFAKMIDVCIFFVIAGVFIGIFYPDYLNTIDAVSDSIFDIVIYFCWFIVEAILLSVFGTTFGKFLFNIKVRELNGDKPKFNSACKRSFWLWCKGFGFGLPFVYLCAFAYSYEQLKKTGTTAWDKNTFVVTHGKVGPIKYIFIILILLSWLMLDFWGRYQDALQKYIDKNPAYKKQLYLQELAKDIEETNKSLPEMISDNTQLLKVTLTDKAINGQYRVTDVDAADVDNLQFYNTMRDKILPNLCHSSFYTSIMANGINVSFEYIDKNKNHIETILVKPSGCQSAK